MLIPGFLFLALATLFAAGMLVHSHCYEPDGLEVRLGGHFLTLFFFGGVSLIMACAMILGWVFVLAESINILPLSPAPHPQSFVEAMGASMKVAGVMFFFAAAGTIIAAAHLFLLTSIAHVIHQGSVRIQRKFSKEAA